MKHEGARGFILAGGEPEILHLPAGPLELLASRGTTGGALAVWRDFVPPSAGPPLHVHKLAHEFFYVLDGDFEFRLEQDARCVSTGGAVFIPRGAPHYFRNVGRTPGQLLGAVAPAGLDDFFRAQTGISAERMTTELYAELGADHDLICVSE